jgi:hypothetical protein
MSRVPINCPHCGKTTRVDLAHNLSTQKCDRCGIRFSSVDTGLAGSREVQLTEPPEWRRAKTGSWDEDPDGAPASPTPAAASGSRAAWIAVGATLAVVAATALAIARRPPPTPPVKPMTGADLAAASAAARPSSYLSLRERIDAATTVARQYLSAQSVEDLLPLIENRDTLEPQVRAYYSEGEGRTQFPLPDFTLAPTERQVWVDDLKAAVISYQTPGQVPRAVALRQSTDGRWLIDWPSAAAIGEVPLADFRARRETTPRLFRLLATRDDYFNRAFANDREWVCLRLTDPTQDQRIYAYARRGTPVAESVLKAPLAKSPTQSPVRLRLRFPADAPTDNQMEITEFVGMGWVTAAEPPSSANPPAPNGP